MWVLGISVGVHLAALGVMGAIHLGRRMQADVLSKPADISVHVIERVLEQPAPKPKPKIEPKPVPTVAVPKPTPPEPTPLPPAEEKVPAANDAVVVSRPVDAVLFCGTETAARRVCYVVDGSGSMFGLMYLVREQLRESILNLSSEQSFNVLFFMRDGIFLQSFEGWLKQATPATKAEALNLIARVRPEGQTAAEKAIEAALRVRNAAGDRAEVIYFLTDGFDQLDGAGDAFVQRIEQLRKKLAPMTIVNTIGIYPEPEDRAILSQVARVCGGRYIEVK